MVSASLAPETVQQTLSFPQVVGGTWKEHVCLLSSESWRLFLLREMREPGATEATGAVASSVCPPLVGFYLGTMVIHQIIQKGYPAWIWLKRSEAKLTTKATTAPFSGVRISDPAWLCLFISSIH